MKYAIPKSTYLFCFSFFLRGGGGGYMFFCVVVLAGEGVYGLYNRLTDNMNTGWPGKAFIIQLDMFKINMSLHIIKYKKHVCSENFMMRTSV